MTPLAAAAGAAITAGRATVARPSASRAQRWTWAASAAVPPLYLQYCTNRSAAAWTERPAAAGPAAPPSIASAPCLRAGQGQGAVRRKKIGLKG
jgi:hypothetical protein